MGTFNARNTTTTMAVTVNAIMKKSAPAPARTVKRNVTKKTAPAKKPTPAKKPKAVKKTAPVKKSVTVKKTVKKAPAPNKAALSAELAKWYGTCKSLVFRRRDSSPKSLDLDLPFERERHHHHHHHHLSFFFDDDDKNA